MLIATSTGDRPKLQTNAKEARVERTSDTSHDSSQLTRADVEIG